MEFNDETQNINYILERKCFCIDNSVESDTEHYLDVVKNIDNEGAVSYLNSSFEQLKNFCESNNIENFKKKFNFPNCNIFALLICKTIF